MDNQQLRAVYLAAHVVKKDFGNSEKFQALIAEVEKLGLDGCCVTVANEIAKHADLATVKDLKRDIKSILNQHKCDHEREVRCGVHK